MYLDFGIEYEVVKYGSTFRTGEQQYCKRCGKTTKNLDESDEE